MSEIEQEGIDRDASEKLAQSLFESYKTRVKEFNKAFNTLFVFTLAFLLLVHIPYVIIKVRSSNLSDKLNALDIQVKQVDEKRAMYSTIQEGINHVHSVILNAPMKLRKQIIQLSEQKKNARTRNVVNSDSQVAQRMLPGQGPEQDLSDAERAIAAAQEFHGGQASPCLDINSEMWIDCKVNKAVADIFADITASLDTQLFQTLESLSQTGEAIDVNNMRSGIADLQNSFITVLNKNREFWKDYRGKLIFFATLDNQVKDFWKQYGSTIDQKASLLNSELTTLKTKRDELQKETVNIESRLKDVAQRVSNIESPFGKLPIGLGESIALFPILIALGFTITANRMHSALKLRAECRSLCRNNSAMSLMFVNKRIDFIAPLALVPMATGVLKIWHILLILLPLLLYVLASVLIFYTWMLESSTPDLLSEMQPLYVILYVISGILMIGGYLRILNVVRHLHV